MDAPNTAERRWLREAIAALESEQHRSADTHLIRLDLPAFPGIPLYLKDESVHPTGSLKHRLARSLFLYGLCNGWIRRDRPVIEASSGSTAISEAWFARLLGLPFVAVVPRATSPDKLAQIAFFGGRCEFAEGCDIYAAAEAIARASGGHYLDQFTYAERATDWRGNNNIAASIFRQLEREAEPVPRWIVVPAGTGGTAATLGRYLRYAVPGSDCRLCVADPEHSVFFDYYRQRDRSLRIAQASRIEGIGRPRVEPSFLPDCIDAMLKVPDAASLAALPLLESLLGRRCGGSTGTNLAAALQLMCDLRARGERGAVLSLICDGGERYRDSLYSPAWQLAQGLAADIPAWSERLGRALKEGVWQDAPMDAAGIA
jgi:cysteine synthase